ncbi:TetR/AcrR family transcriptional regulator [Kribbella sp. NPDC050470]|uniref:TetR/AcrR family transcriptional regulator n=1 Tax=unclassified Kribbella TaxID=2644121 RepID=UPI00378859A1
MVERRRQEDRSRATRTALISAARPLFAERGYGDVSAEEIVGAAGLTRGALRHHFGGKPELFRAVLEQLEGELTARILAEITDPQDAWSALTDGMRAFLDACEDPELIQIALTDAPAVLGWTAWREIEADHGLGLIIAGLERARLDGVISQQPVDVAARLLLSATIEAALLIATGDDRAAARSTAEDALLSLLSGLRKERQ